MYLRLVRQRKESYDDTAYDIARRGRLEKAFESTRLFDRLVRLGVGNFGRNSIWEVSVNHSRSWAK
jgi:hypothetical protein